MNNDLDLNQIDADIKTAKQFIKDRDSFYKLEKNREFKKIILEDYFKTEAARLAMSKSADLSDSQLRNIDNMIYGVGGLHNYFMDIIRRGDQAEAYLVELEADRDELLSQQVEAQEL